MHSSDWTDKEGSEKNEEKILISKRKDVLLPCHQQTWLKIEQILSTKLNDADQLEVFFLFF